MAIRRWQHWLSYVQPLTLQVTSSVHNPSLIVLLTQGRLQLQTPDAVYSYDERYDNFFKTFQHLDWAKMAAFKRVLMAGLGLGSVPFMLERIFKQHFSYDLIEIDGVIIRLAQQYSLSRLHSPYRIFEADAVEFISDNPNVYDMIVIDLFINDIIPAAAQQIDFLRQLQRCLTPDGLLLYNCLSYFATDKIDTQHFFTHTFKAVFPEAVYYDTQTNWVLLNTNKYLTL